MTEKLIPGTLFLVQCNTAMVSVEPFPEDAMDWIRPIVDRGEIVMYLKPVLSRYAIQKNWSFDTLTEEQHDKLFYCLKHRHTVQLSPSDMRHLVKVDPTK